MLADQRLIRLPLVRGGGNLVVGFEEKALKELLIALAPSDVR